jgi:apolipoprotein N-acyltransferase
VNSLDDREPLAPLAPLRRLGLQLAGWLALVLAGPGILAPDGVWLLAVPGVALWAASASRPGRGAFWVEWLASSLAWAWICGWAWHVWPGSLLFIGPANGLYACLATWLLRRLARTAPLALAAPLAWIGVETAKSLLEPPFGFPWMRLGTHFHAADWILGSARVWGVIGLGFVLAALGGGLVDLVRSGGAKLARTGALAVAPLFVGVLLSARVAAPETVDGPRLLLVQPGIPQQRKMESRGGKELFLDGCKRTQEGLDRVRAGVEAEPDLVCWGETMLGIPVLDRGLKGAVESGARTDPWVGFTADAEWIDGWLDVEDNWIAGALFGRAGGGALLPAGASFLAGAETFVAHEGRVRRKNSVVLWNADGARAGVASKVHLVPSAETMIGLERFAFVRTAIGALAGYVPDLLADDEAGVLELASRDGRRWRFGASVCFDNAFDDPYTGPARAGELAFHLIVSNEAWYRESHEVDQMIAFSRLEAVQTGRAVVRATNSGVSALIGADGRELARLVVDGRDREVGGTLAVTVPVPEPGTGPTPYVRSERVWQVLAVLGPAILLAYQRWRSRRSQPRGNRGLAAGSHASG